MLTKTTIELPEELVMAAKRHAAVQRTTLKALVERGLRAELGKAVRGVSGRRGGIRWVTAKGGLPAGLDVADRAAMHDRVRRS